MQDKFPRYHIEMWGVHFEVKRDDGAPFALQSEWLKNAERVIGFKSNRVGFILKDRLPNTTSIVGTFGTAHAPRTEDQILFSQTKQRLMMLQARHDHLYQKSHGDYGLTEEETAELAKLDEEIPDLMEWCAHNRKDDPDAK